MNEKWLNYARSSIQRAIQLKQEILEGEQLVILCDMAEKIYARLKLGGKLLLCGNGGSAADAQHLATELVVRLRPHIERQALPAISLAGDTVTLTACGNDYGFEHIFERAIAALGQPTDVLIGITTSGRSMNIIRALEAARAKNILAFGFLGGNGGKALSACDMAFIVPSEETSRIQEVHIMAGHILLELVEEFLLLESKQAITKNH